MTFIGMDPEQVLQIARKLEREKLRVNTVAVTVANTVASARGCWRGSDVDRFTADWNGKHRAKLQLACEALDELARKASANATAQMQTSNNYAGGVGGPGPVDGPGGLPGSNPGPVDGPGGLGGGTTGVSRHGSFSTGPHVSHQWHGSAMGINATSSSDAWIGGDGNYDVGASVGPNGADAHANGHIRAGAGADWKGTVGNKWFNGEADAHVFSGVQANLDSSAHVGDDGANINASGSAMIGDKASVHMQMGNQYANTQTTVEGFDGAEASGDIGAHVDGDGVGGGAHWDAFAGDKVTVSQSNTFLGMTTNSSVSFEEGVGVGGGADASISAHDVGFDVDLSGALGDGLGASVGFHIDPTVTANQVSSLASEGWDAASEGWHSFTSVFH